MSILDDIVRDTRGELARRRAARPRAALERACRGLAAPRDFEGALRPAPGRVALIAEVKRASPSRGVLAADVAPAALARTYAAAGAAAISVLTDATYFHGSLDDLAAVRAAVGVPLLRKDFTLDEYQLWESRAAGADAVLLIVSILAPALLRDLLAAGSRVVGLNNRDLGTFETRIETTLELAPLIPPGPIVVSESGFFTAADVRRVAAAGVRAVLVGEGLVRAPDVAAKVRELTLRP